METADQVREIVESAFPGCEAEVEYDKRLHKVSGVLVWSGFQGLDQVDRQKLLWGVLQDKVASLASQVSIIFTYTPDERRLLMAS